MPVSHKSGAGFYSTLGVVAVIILACLAMLFILQPGLPTEPDIALRMGYMHDHRVAWFGAWFLWMLSAFGLLLFCFLLLPFLPGSVATYYALAVVAIGVVPDITAEFIFATVLPWMAGTAAGANGTTAQMNMEQFRTLEFLAVVLTGAFGNGAYNAGGLMLNIIGFRNPALPRWLLWFGIPSWLLGLALGIATVVYELSWMRLLTAASMALSVTWMLLVALVVFRQPRRYVFGTKGRRK